LLPRNRALQGAGGGLCVSVDGARGLGCGARVCIRLPIQRKHGADVVCGCVSAGGGAMASANERLREAAYRGDVADIAAALLAGADPNAFERDNDWTALQWAAYNGHVAAIAALLAAGARVDGADSNGRTPLMYAAIKGRTAAIAALLSAGADVNRAEIGDYRYTALHGTSTWGFLGAARVLLQAGARTDMRNKEGQRPIDKVRMHACSLGAAACSHRRCAAASHAQLCTGFRVDKSDEAALAALLASAEPWSRRRPVAIACYGVECEWEA
jgi:hypothetical protein